MIAELERRTREHFEDTTSTHLDYVCAWVESGKTKSELSTEIADAILVPDMLPSMLGNYLRSTWGEEVERRLAAARATGAHGLVDATIRIADEKIEDAAHAAAARNRIGARQWTAERWGRQFYGTKPADGARVTLNLGVLHLDALRARTRPLEAGEDIREATAVATLSAPVGDEPEVAELVQLL